MAQLMRVINPGPVIVPTVEIFGMAGVEADDKPD